MKTYAKVDNQSIIGVGSLKELYPGTIFSKYRLPFLIETGQLCEVLSSKLFNSRTEKLVNVEPYLEDGKCYSVQAAQKTPEEIELDITNQWTYVRGIRDGLLKESDWTVLPDAPVDSEAWKQYRQQLRDITSQVDPFEISWPVEPVLNSNNNVTNTLDGPSGGS